jgi:hypothetical protein
MQLVFEFGSTKAHPIIEAMERAISELPYDIKCLPTSGGNYIPTNDTLASAEAKLGEGKISAFSAHPRTGTIRFALILKPHFEGQPLSIYLGTIEYTGRDHTQIWDILLDTQGLTVACLGFEEGLELKDTQLTIEAFPWNQWPLVLGALRDHSDSSSWTVREGPEMWRLAGSQSGNGAGGPLSPATS